MKKFLITLLPLLLLLSLAAQAQENNSPEKAPGRYLGSIELGFLYQDNKDNAPSTADTSPTITIFNGYRFHRLFSLGATVGLDFYNQILVTPVALGIRGTLLNTRLSPFYSVDAGYGTTFLSDESDQIENKGGWMFNPALGMRVSTGNNTAFSFSLGYKTQRATTKEPLPWNNNTIITEEYSFKRLSARIGFMF